MPVAKTLPLFIALIVAALLAAAVQKCTKFPGGVMFFILLLIVLPLIYARATEEKDRMIFLGVFQFGIATFALAYIFSLVERHKREDVMYIVASLAVLVGGGLIARAR